MKQVDAMRLMPASREEAFEVFWQARPPKRPHDLPSRHSVGPAFCIFQTCLHNVRRQMGNDKGGMASLRPPAKPHKDRAGILKQIFRFLPNCAAFCASFAPLGRPPFALLKLRI